MLIRSRNREWPSGAGAFTLRTAASIVTASKSAPITQPTTSSENEETAGAHRAITFLSDKYFSGKCGWVLTLRMSAHARRQSRKARLRRPPEAQLLRVHPDNKQQSRLRLALLRLEQVQTRRQRVSVLPRQMHRLQ